MNRALQAATRNFSVLFVGCVLFHIAGTWSLPLVDRDEPRFAEAAREMRERGDYVVPYFNNHYRFDKPPLTYWLQGGSYWLFGENDFAARFPSAIAAAFVAMLLLAWGRRMENERVGWWSAIIFTLCLQTVAHAKAAVADIWLVLFVTGAHWAGWELLRDKLAVERRTSNAEHRTSKSKWWIFYAALAFAFLAKGPIGFAPLLTVAVTQLFLRDPDLPHRFTFLRGCIVTLAIIAVWGIPALIATHGEFFRVGIGYHVIRRSIATMEGHGGRSLGMYFLTLPFYFVTIFFSFFPWSIKLPWLMRKVSRNGGKTNATGASRLQVRWLNRQAGVGAPGDDGRDATDNYLLAGAVIIFVTFTLVKTKLPHYTLPAFPLLALILARHWSRASDATQNFKRIAIGSGLVWLAIALVIFPLSARFFPARQLFVASRNDLRPEMQFGAVGYNEPSLVWYFRTRVNGFLDSALDAERVLPFLEEQGGRFVILPTALATKLYPTLPVGWKSFSVSGINIAKGRRVDLTLILKPG